MRKLTLVSLFASFSLAGIGQSNTGNLTGNVESIFQYLRQDSLIGANQPPSKGLLNTYMNVFYTYGNFKAGLRVESYLPRIQGYPNRFDGTGIGMRYVGYANDFIDITLGSFYEQFGSGLALRAYEDRALGYDNLLDGVRLVVRPYKGVTLKGVYGYQRLSFQQGEIVHGAGIVRGFDGELHLNEVIPGMAESKLNATIGGSLVSKYQVDDNDDLILPENVGSYGGRFKLRYGKFSLDGEYIIKEQDPSNDNNYIYNYGHAAVFNLAYSQKGLGILFSGKSADNMSFRSDRTKDLQDVFINYLPALNKTHTYNLVATLYPYATQPLGEVAYQTEVLYTIPKGTALGGKYGTVVNFNASITRNPIRHTSGIDPLDSSRVFYKNTPFEWGSTEYWRDINININRKLNKQFNIILSYFNIHLNNDIAKISNDAVGIIKSHIAVLEAGYKFNSKHALRAELQGLFLEPKDDGSVNDKGDWATLLLEYTISPSWFFSFMLQNNYGNPNEFNSNPVDIGLFSERAKAINYPIVTCGYIRESTRFMVSYGRQRAGLFCVGGVCRFVPANNGLTLSFTHSF